MISESSHEAPHDTHLIQENEELRSRLEQAEEILRAIRRGEVDGLVVNGSQGEQVFTLAGADYPYRMLIEQMNEGALTLSSDGIILYCNNSFAQMLKKPAQKSIGSSVFEMLNGPELSKFRAGFSLKENADKGELDLLREDGSRLPVCCSIKPMCMGEVQCVSMVVTDLTHIKERAGELKLANLKLQQEIAERKRTEETLRCNEQRLRQSEERFFKAFHLSPVMMAILNMEDNHFIEVNQKYIDTIEYSREELIGHTPIELDIYVDKEHSLRQIAHFKAQGRITSTQHLVRTKSGKILTVLGSLEPIQLNDMQCRLFAFQDISQQKQMEFEMARLDRLHLIGEMAASIGHEIRNPLTSIRGFLQLLNGKEGYQEDSMFFDLMIEELDRANDIISEYLGMAKDKKVDLQPQDIGDVVNSLYPMIQSDAIYREINVRLELEQVPQVRVDMNEIRQLILNMARNAIEAMAPGGTLTMGTFVNENNAILFIKDNGPGLPPDMLDKLGTPFITTKERGTGLGLAVCYSIAARHNARIEFETGPAGTTFYTRFPLPIEQGSLF